ncbi:trihelix transcription factor GT-2-like [Leptopilina heterotoma]|uniref:trihelix transcription factor GT-2-like n=1 Tax=Leptopilina heterotoma TaxID=63436 RepID=UPI001CAA33A5|nr:trihelix transcription factor GT-2-like [Leptopilina heterotoma]XP_043479887.1 trihelix transcription factor GT-2-like [Leptopilina heterotoma]
MLNQVQNSVENRETNCSMEAINDLMDSDEEIVSGDEHAVEALENEKKWPTEKVKFLLNVYEEVWENPANKKKIPKSLWEIVTKRLNEIGVKCSVKDCTDKFKSLKKTYKNQKKKKETSGEGRSTKWEHYDAMHNLLYKKPEMNPVATSSNITGFKKGLKESINGPTDVSSDAEEKIKQPRKRKHQSDVEKVLEFMKEKEEKKEKFLERFLSVLEKK